MSDLISRQEAIMAIEEYADRLQMVNWKENPGVPYKVYSLNWCINTIRDLPSAVKHGEWIATHERTVFSHPDSITYVCSECGYKIYTIYGMPSTTTYCPSCGARMDGEENE